MRVWDLYDEEDRVYEMADRVRWPDLGLGGTAPAVDRSVSPEASPVFECRLGEVNVWDKHYGGEGVTPITENPKVDPWGFDDDEVPF